MGNVNSETKSSVESLYDDIIIEKFERNEISYSDAISSLMSFYETSLDEIFSISVV